MAERPGIIVYFDLLPQLEEYSPEEVGELFLAMLRFGLDGSIPIFEDRGMRIIWRELQSKIERDNAKYQQRVINGAYGAYTRDLKKENGGTPMPKDLWTAQIWIPSQKSPEVDGSILKATSKPLEGENQLEQGTTTTTSSGTGTGAGKGKGTGGRVNRSTPALVAADPAQFEKKRQAQIEALDAFTKAGAAPP